MALPSLLTGTNNPNKQASVTWGNNVRSRLAEMPSLSDYGTVEQGGDVTDALDAAIADAISNNTSHLRIPTGTYTVSGSVVVDADNLEIHGHGATIQSAMTANSPLMNLSGDGIKVIGLRTELTDSSTTAHHYKVNGARCSVLFCDMEYTGGSVNTPGFYPVGDNLILAYCTMRGNNAFCGTSKGSDHLFAFNDIECVSGGDDAFALKAIEGNSENIRIIGNRVKGFSCLLSIGSQIGATTDVASDRTVRNITCVGNVLEECGGLLNIRPGGTSGTNYYNGTVEDIVFSDNVLLDPNAVKYDIGFDIKPGRGATIRRVRGNNNIIQARVTATASGFKTPLTIRHSGSGGACTIEDFDVEVIYVDPLEGVVANGTTGAGATSTNGQQSTNLVYIDPADLTLSNINIRFEGNGCRSSGVYVLSGGDGAVFVEKLKIKNWNVVNGASNAGFRTASAITVMTDNILITDGTGSEKVADTGGSFTANTNVLLA